MRVLFVGNPASQPTDGGSATFQHALLAGLRRIHSRHELFYVQPVPGNATLQSIVDEKKADLVWFMYPYYEPVQVPFAATVWDLGHRELPYFPELSLSGWTFEHREAYYRQVLPRASIVVIGNAVGARNISRLYQVSPDVICEIPLPVDAAALQGISADSGIIQPYGLTPAQYLFYPAQFWPHKNHITLIDALAILRSCGKQFRLVFCGSDKGNRSYVEDYAAQCKQQDAVVFAGFVEDKVLHQLYLNAYAMVFASLLGPDNLPPLEAMAHGCPVICASFNGAREQLGEAALFFEGLDPHDAAAQVLKLQEPGMREQLIGNGHALIKTCGPDEYCRRINHALDRFSRIRRLWASGSVYRHL
jgi:glycosyltransferase involved in cell wall biosynthesis